MKKFSIAIIGSKHFKKSTIKSLKEEGLKKFKEFVFAPINKIIISNNKGKTEILYRNQNLLEFDAVYPRLTSKDFAMAQVLLKALDEQSKTYCPVSLFGYNVSNHKYYTIKELANEGIPIVVSTLFISPETAAETIKELGFPAVLKLLSGFAGKGVILVRDEKQMQSILDTVQMFDEFISAQKFVEGTNSDIRCYVFGEKVVSVRRIGKQGEWRANISRGGIAKEISLKSEMKKIALDSAKVLKMEICAVDLIETKKGLAVIEVNFMPGPFKKFLGNKITKEMIEFIYKKVDEMKKNK